MYTSGRFAALTNFSGPDDAPAALSRGWLVHELLTGSDSAVHYGHHLHGPDYAGFIRGRYDGEDMVYTSNKGTTDLLHPGFSGLSNAELGAEWPKCISGAAGLRQIVENPFDSADLIGLLHDSDIPPDDQLPHRGRPVELERRVAPSFIVGDEYGTRASTSLIMTPSQIRFTEQSYLAGGVSAGLADFQIDLVE